ncbi:hypothetical protein EYF80_052585 [Liparis tanakae]|uniref:Uncharacterized protein n=1 Tax=Liparis tanakae TaxID=230148 RepID=A0A4Z2F8Y3_9TELE|nr:hypothetical protein EYF80_052585 [Liparis tanakae]
MRNHAVKGSRNLRCGETTGERRGHGSQLTERVIGKEEGGLGVGEQESLCEVSGLTRKDRKDQASERDTNQRLLMGSGDPGKDRSAGGEGLEHRQQDGLMLCTDELSPLNLTAVTLEQGGRRLLQLELSALQQHPASSR